VDFALPAEDDPHRASLRRWLEAHPAPSARELAESGLVAPHWPAPWGIGADPTHQLIVDDELRRGGVRRPTNTIGIGWAGPTLLFAGTPAQKDRYLFPLLSGEEIWCRLRPGLVDHPGRPRR
jgi:alkylation response protein AidB-like acyl-CoA dehydrogenase